jgi:3-hydroxyacyl-CoA dehydrogenase
MKNIAVIGAGTMGNGIAHVFAQFGYRVNLIDVSQASLDKAIATIGKNLDRQLAKEAITESEKQNTLLIHGISGSGKTTLTRFIERKYLKIWKKKGK